MAPTDAAWPAHYGFLLDKYRKLLSHSLRLMNIGDLMQNELNRVNEQLKLAEEARKASEEMYRLIFENIEDVYYEAGMDSTILQVSPSVHRHLWVHAGRSPRKFHFADMGPP